MLEVVKMAESSAPTGRSRENMPKDLANIPSFVKQCCTAYNLLRKYAFSIMGTLEMVSLFSLTVMKCIFRPGKSNFPVWSVAKLGMSMEIFVDPSRMRRRSPSLRSNSRN